MKHITSKLLSLLLTLAMLLSIIPAAYAEGTEGTTEGSTSMQLPGKRILQEVLAGACLTTIHIRILAAATVSVITV